MSLDPSILPHPVLGGSFPAWLPKSTQCIPYLAGVRRVGIWALPAGPGQGSHHQHPKNEDEEPQGVGKHGLSRQELVLRGSILPGAGKRGWECSGFSQNPPQTLQGSVQGATHLRKCSVPSALCWSLPNPAQIHILSPPIPLRALPKPPHPCEGSSQAPPLTLTG